MELVALIIVSLLLAILGFAYIKRKAIISTEKKINMKGILPIGIKQIICFIAIPASLILAALMFELYYENELLDTLKHLAILGILWPVAISDYKELRIPNKLLLCGLILRAILLVFELIFSFDKILWILADDGIAAVGFFVLSLLCALISKGGMGMGDVKLMTLAGLFLGIEGICYSLFASMFILFIVSIFLLVARKKKKSDVVPFGPFVLIGTFLSMILSGV